MKHGRRLGRVASVIAILVGTATIASADEQTRYYSGADCLPESGFHQEHVVAKLDGSMMNTINFVLHVFCSLPGDILDDIYQPDGATMLVHDWNASQKVSCTLACRDYDSTSVYSELQETGTSQTGDNIALSWTLDTWYNDGACFFDCSLPQANPSRSGIDSYEFYMAF